MKSDQISRIDAKDLLREKISCHKGKLERMSVEDENGRVVQGRAIFNVLDRQFHEIKTRIVDPAWDSVYGARLSINTFPFGFREFQDDVAYVILYYGDDERAASLESKNWYRHALEEVEFIGYRKKKMLEECALILNEYRRKHKETYEFMCRSNRSLLDDYFAGLYDISSFIHNNGELSDGDKETMIHEFQSQLITNELNTWHYHLHANMGESESIKNLERLIKKYQLLAGTPFGLDYKY